MPVRVMKVVGVETLIATNAGGGLNNMFTVSEVLPGSSSVVTFAARWETSWWSRTTLICPASPVSTRSEVRHSRGCRLYLISSRTQWRKVRPKVFPHQRPLQQTVPWHWEAGSEVPQPGRDREGGGLRDGGGAKLRDCGRAEDVAGAW